MAKRVRSTTEGGKAEGGEVVEASNKLEDFTLVIGNRAYSSWSLRAWLAVRVAAGKPASEGGFHEVVADLAGAGNDDMYHKLRQYSPTGKVPALWDEAESLTVWESLAICEYVAECAAVGVELWPAERAARAVARSACAEMASSFGALRGHMPMNTRKSLPGEGMGPGVQKDIDRICELWAECRVYGQAVGGEFLFGHFTIADAMFAPIVLRFRTYAPQLPPHAEKYCRTIENMAEIQEWCADAAAESHRIEQYEK